MESVRIPGTKFVLSFCLGKKMCKIDAIITRQLAFTVFCNNDSSVRYNESIRLLKQQLTCHSGYCNFSLCTLTLPLTLQIHLLTVHTPSKAFPQTFILLSTYIQKGRHFKSGIEKKKKKITPQMLPCA